MSRTDHPRKPGTNRVVTKRQRIFWEPGYSEPRPVKIRKAGERNRAAIEEGLTEYREGPPSEPSAIERGWKRLNRESERVLEHLRSWDPRDPSVTNHLLHNA